MSALVLFFQTSLELSAALLEQKWNPYRALLPTEKKLTGSNTILMQIKNHTD